VTSASFTSAQLQAINADSGPIAIVAGPGCGKTTLLAARIGVLVRERGLDPSSILVLSFTTEAAHRLRREVALQLGERAADVSIQTLHALGRRVIDNWAIQLGYEGRPSVLHHDEAAALLASAASDQGWDLTAVPVGELAAAVDRCRLLVDTRARQADPLTPLAQAYEERLRRHGAIDFVAMLSLPPVRGQDEDELIALRAATSLYHRRLLTDPEALDYLAQRGVERATVESCRLGYAAGGELVHHLRWMRHPLGPALHVGLLTHAGREFMAGRIVVPEFRHGEPVWLVGRLLETVRSSLPESDPPPRYLALRGSKPLLGAELAWGSATVIVTEGVFDFITLRQWGYPTVALVGTHTRPDVLDQLRAFERLYLVLDQDDSGIEATFRLLEVLGPRAIPVALPDGVKDVAELAPRPDGPAAFAAALLESVGGLDATSA
jgi:hypothetical protein